MPDLKVLTYNVRGLREVSKRRAVFRFLHTQYPNYISILQETHSCPRDMPFWQAEWGSQILFSHGVSVNESGVSVLVPRSFQGIGTVKLGFASDDGRLIVADIEYNKCKIKLIAAYAPHKNRNNLQV